MLSKVSEKDKDRVASELPVSLMSNDKLREEIQTIMKEDAELGKKNTGKQQEYKKIIRMYREVMKKIRASVPPKERCRNLNQIWCTTEYNCTK